MRIVIIGGGIGGLSAALQLLKTGVDVHVYEQAPQIGEVGAARARYQQQVRIDAENNLGIGRDRGMKLFRQPKLVDWTSVLERVATEVSALAAAKK